MRAQAFDGAGRPLCAVVRPVPEPEAGEVLVRVTACAVCRTDLHVVDGDLPRPKANVIPGHEVVGRIAALGPGVTQFKLGDRIGVPWLGWTCGTCSACVRGEENLCERAEFTGYTRDGGFAEFMVADARYVFALPARYDDAHAAPLLCAGLIGFRAYRMAGAGRRLGLYGFGAAAHILCQIAVADGREVYAFVRAGDDAAAGFARKMGAHWAGGSDVRSPAPLDAAILFAPVGALVPKALGDVRPGGTVVAAGIHMTDIPSFPYSLLWQERRLCSVANLTRQDGEAFFVRAGESMIATETVTYPLDAVNEALDDLREGRFNGAAVLAIGEP